MLDVGYLKYETRLLSHFMLMWKPLRDIAVDAMPMHENAKATKGCGGQVECESML